MAFPTSEPAPATSPARTLARLLLAAFLLTAGIGHFVATETFLAQTPTWLPARTLIVQISGAVEIALGLALVTLPRWRREVGWVVAAFFLAVFPGNIHQAVTDTAAFGLDSPTARWSRLALQPVLIVWALWATGAWPRSRAAPGGDAQSGPAST